jgi:two-component sensor histidine kinase
VNTNLYRNGNRVILETSGVPILDEQCRLTGYRGVNKDITERKAFEKRLMQFNEELEKGIAERTEQLNTSLKEKEVLLREVHYRVKNNLQIVASLLNLQSRYIKDEHVLNTIRESQNRVKAMALVHEKLYRSENISEIALENYVKFLTDNLFRYYGANPRRSCSPSTSGM